MYRAQNLCVYAQGYFDLVLSKNPTGTGILVCNPLQHPCNGNAFSHQNDASRTMNKYGRVQPMVYSRAQSVTPLGSRMMPLMLCGESYDILYLTTFFGKVNF